MWEKTGNERKKFLIKKAKIYKERKKERKKEQTHKFLNKKKIFKESHKWEKRARKKRKEKKGVYEKYGKKENE